jgi:Sigma-54 interaction domain
MWNPLPAVPFTMRASGPLDRAPVRPADWQLSRAVDVVRLVAGLPRVNLLLVGVERDMWQPLQDQLSDLAEPIVTWSPGKRLGFPPATEPGTLILRDVDRLSSDDQRQLLEWLEPAGRRMRVISVASAALYPRVEAGAFIDTLYYRLNTVTLEINERSAAL